MGNQPRCKLPGFYSIGPIFDGHPMPWIDIYVGSKQRYEFFNDLLQRACKELRIDYVDHSRFFKEQSHDLHSGTGTPE